MSTPVITAIAIFGMLLLMLTGMPIALALAFTGIVGLFLLGGGPLLLAIPELLYTYAENYILLAIPLYVLMAQAILVTGLGTELFEAARKWLSRLPAGLAIATIAACTVFAAMSGSSAAATGGIGSLALPEMTKRGYSTRLSAGCVAGAGTLAMMIPPSISFIVYAMLADESVGKLFMAGVIPGLLLSAAFTVWVLLYVTIRPSVAPTTSGYPWRERFRALVRVWPAMLLIFSVMGLIYTGVTTATEAAATGSFTALALAAFWYRTLDWRAFRDIVKGTVRISTSILIIVACALIYGYLLLLLRAPQTLAEWVSGIQASPIVLILMMNVVLWFLGCFMEAGSMTLIVVPLFLPIVKELGLSTVWFGVIVVLQIEIAVLTPPMGVHLFLIKSIAPQMSLRDIILGTFPFIIVETFVLGIIIAFPILSLWLPSMMR